MDIKLV